jgi:hypothetical protein
MAKAMSKRIVMSIMASLVASIVCTVGTFSCKPDGPAKVTVIVQHPDNCYMLDHSPMAAGLSTGADMVSVKPGMNSFTFDCEGRQSIVKKEVKEGQLMMSVSP